MHLGVSPDDRVRAPSTVDLAKSKYDVMVRVV